MIVVNIFGEIEPIVISNKLGITLSNLPKDWQEELIETMEEEIYYRVYDSKKYSRFGNIEQYDVKKIVAHKNFLGLFNPSEKEYLKEISKKLTCISIEDFENSLLQKKNPYMDSPTCEIEFGEKWIDFYRFIINNECNKKNWIPLTCMYSSEKSNFEKTGVLRVLYGEMNLKFNRNSIDYNQRKINSLLEFGKMIDSFLEIEENFHMLDYIMTAVADDSNYNAYHLIKNYSLMEMIVGKKNLKNPAEFDKKLSLFIESDRYETDEQKKLFAQLIRQIRNKIAHGDFIGVRGKLEDYATHFMKNYNFDYFEYSRENWIYLNICCELDTILANILWALFSEQFCRFEGVIL
ncbi:hypothetical protein [Bacillus cereus]|uniref:Apea-like HEPN domain-containing protein n=1 Tax=Bacillus cereus TaxID=1396 RepID=A0A2A8ZYG5_BACCE|nr:hypothetical protein [Bacillus cereus]PFE14041.1 hypothetical protein CN307_17575 [Bacillus cereus]